MLTGCTADNLGANAATSNASTAGTPVAARQLKQFPIVTESKYPTVGLKEYVLITDNLQRDRAEAEVVIQTKIELPHAMQTKKREDFEAVLGRNYVFRAHDEFFDREGYISNRVADPAKVKQADYRNVVIQFITPDRALVTYSNVIEDQPGRRGA